MLHGDTSRRIDVSLQPFEEFPARMAFSPDGRLLAIIGNSMQDPLVIVDAATGVERSRLQVPWKNQPSGLLWLDDTQLLAGDFNDGFTVERRGDSAWAVGRSMPGYWTGMRSIGGNRVVVCALGGQLVERDVRTGERGREYDGMSDMARTAAISPDGSLLAAVGTDRRLHIFDTRTSEQLLSIMGHPTGRMVTDVIFCADGSRVLTIDNAGGLLDWDTREHRPATTANQ
jgi:WD40 repeat protein